MQGFAHCPEALWLDGKIVCPTSVGQTFFSSHSFHYGSAAFEGIRSYAQKNADRPLLFKGLEHYERLKKSALFLGWPNYPYQTSYLIEQTYALLAKASLLDSYVRPIVFLRNQDLKIATDHSYFSLAIAVYRWPQNFFDGKKNISVALCPHQGPSGSLRSYKLSAHYAYTLPFQLRARQAGFDDILRVDNKGFCQEFSGANLGYVLNEKIYLPKTQLGLNGITKNTLIALCQQENIPVEIARPLSVKDLDKIQGLFSIGTATEICPIAQVNHIQIASSRNDLIIQLSRAYQKLTRENESST